MFNTVKYDPEFLADIVERVAHPIFVKDRSFRLVLVNQAFATMIRRSQAEIVGKTDYDLFPTVEADFFRAKDIEVFRVAKPVVIEAEPITDANGQRHVLATTKVPRIAADGSVTHLIGIMHDITERKDAEDALRLMNEELEFRVEDRTRALRQAQEELVRKERLAVLGELAGGVAHQIRNPLGIINNAAYLLGRRIAADDEEARRALTIIHDEVARANQIITGMLDYARVRTAERRALPLSFVIDQALMAAAVPSSVKLERALPELPSIAVDPAQVQAALCNLIRNAVEAMPDGGSLRISANRLGEFIELRLRDSGPGIAQTIMPRLFEPLSTNKVNGLGLGLVTARTLIERQGGSLNLEETGPGGASFVLRLPIADEFGQPAVH